MPSEETTHSADADRSTALAQLRLDFDQSDAPLLGEQVIDEVAVRLSPAGVAFTAARLGCRRTMLKCKAPPANRARDANPKMGCRRSATHAAVNRSNNPSPKVLRKRSQHRCWPSASSRKLKSEPRPLRNPSLVGTRGNRGSLINRQSHVERNNQCFGILY